MRVLEILTGAGNSPDRRSFQTNVRDMLAIRGRIVRQSSTTSSMIGAEAESCDMVFTSMKLCFKEATVRQPGSKENYGAGESSVTYRGGHRGPKLVIIAGAT